MVGPSRTGKRKKDKAHQSRAYCLNILSPARSLLSMPDEALEGVRASTEEYALQRAADHLGKPLAECLTCRAELVIFAAEGKAPRLAYRVQALFSVAEGWEVMVDAQTGEVLQKLSVIQKGTSRRDIDR